jgi:RND family efflux transporter MFP subunit
VDMKFEIDPAWQEALSLSRKRRILCPLVLAVLLFFFAAPAWAQSPGQTSKQPLTQSLAGPAPMNVQAIGGVVRPARKAVLSFAREGIIRALPKEGRMVRKGELLASLDERRAQNSVNMAHVGRNAAHAALREAIHDRDVQKGLVSEDIVTEEGYRNLEFKVEFAEIKVKEAETRLAAARLDRADCRLEAPFDGVVSRLQAQEAEWIDRGQPVMELGDTTHLELSTDIPLALTANLKPGQVVEISDSGQIVGSATMRTMLPLLDPASGLRRVIWDVTPQVEVLSGRYVLLAPW